MPGSGFGRDTIMQRGSRIAGKLTEPPPRGRWKIYLAGDLTLTDGDQSGAGGGGSCLERSLPKIDRDATEATLDELSGRSRTLRPADSGDARRLGRLGDRAVWLGMCSWLASAIGKVLWPISRASGKQDLEQGEED